MTEMFQSATSFNQNLGAWNVEKVTNMSSMFQSATAFNNSGSNTINNWRPISCSNFSSMFNGATAFNQPIGNWTIGTGSNMNVTMSNMFRSTPFNQNIGAWDVSRVTNIGGMFQGNGAFNNSGSSDINNWRPISCSSFSSMFHTATAFNQPIGNWPLSASNINMSEMFNSAGAFNQDLSTWDLSGVTNTNGVRYMFLNATAFNNGGSPGINNWNTGNIKTMEGMFQNATAFNQDIGNWNVSSCTNFNSFMSGKSAANYSYLHTIYDGWINNKLQPNQTITFNTIKYSGSAAEGRALLVRAYNTASITG
jgi:surface protein